MKKKIEDIYEDEDDQQNENEDNYNDLEQLFNFERHLTLAEERDEDEQNINEVDGQENTDALEQFQLVGIYVNDDQIKDFNEQLEVDSTPDSDQRKNSVSIDNVFNNLTQQSVASQVQLTKVSTAHINPKKTNIPSTPAAVQKIAKAITTATPLSLPPLTKIQINNRLHLWQSIFNNWNFL